MQKQHLGRWLGVADRIGNGLTYKVINEKAEIVSRSAVTKLSNDEYSDPIIQTRLKSLNVSTYESIGNYDETKEKDNQCKNLFIDEDEPHPNKFIDFMVAVNIPDADNEQYT